MNESNDRKTELGLDSVDASYFFVLIVILCIIMNSATHGAHIPAFWVTRALPWPWDLQESLELSQRMSKNTTEQAADMPANQSQQIFSYKVLLVFVVIFIQIEMYRIKK